MNYCFKKIIAMFIASLLISSSTFPMQLIQKDEKLTKSFEDTFLQSRINEIMIKLDEIYLFHKKSLQILGKQKCIIAEKDYPDEVIKELFDNSFYFNEFLNEDYIKNFPNNFDICRCVNKQAALEISITLYSIFFIILFVIVISSLGIGRNVDETNKISVIAFSSFFGILATHLSIVFAIKRWSEYKYKQSYRFLLEPDLEGNNGIISKTEIQNYVNENLKIFIELSKAIICDDNYECKVDNEILQKGLEKIKEYSLMFKELHEETAELS